MKQIILFFLTLTFNGFIIGQYDFNTTMETYQDLSNPISLNNNVSWNNSSIFPVYFNFDFQVGSQTFSAVNVMAGGGLSFPGQGSHQLRVYGHPDSGYLLEDRDQLNSASPISYEISGDTGGQILKIQWENAGFREWCASSDASDYVNFQIWIYESNNKIEVHFGDYQANAGAYGQPDCNSGTDGAQFIFEFDNCNNALSLTGNADLPSYDFRDHCIWQPGIHISGTPSSGIVYNLVQMETTISEIIKTNIQIYPNPATQYLTVESNYLYVSEIEIIDLTGKTIKTITQNTSTIDITDLSQGIYFINLFLNDMTVTRKFAKQ